MTCMVFAAMLSTDSCEGIPWKDGDLIATSFISGEDLERGKWWSLDAVRILTFANGSPRAPGFPQRTSRILLLYSSTSRS